MPSAKDTSRKGAFPVPDWIVDLPSFGVCARASRPLRSHIFTRVVQKAYATFIGACLFDEEFCDFFP